MGPHYSHCSRENATPSSGTSPLASYKGVPSPGVKPIVANGVKADRLSRVFKKIFLKCMILAAYRCIEEDNFDCKL